MKCRIVSHKKDETGYFHLVIDAPEITRECVPGQFLMLKVSGEELDPLLRRPISIMDAHENGHLEMLYKVVGKGTRILARIPEGFELDIIGPLGNGFDIPEAPHKAILVGGGIGIPPLVNLCRKLTLNPSNRVAAFLGARSGNDLPMVKRFEKLGARVFTTTETGDTGQKGLVTAPLIKFLENDEDKDQKTEQELQNAVIYACGPDPMLKAIKQLAESRGIPAQLSLEEHMGCGVGACLGCVVMTTEGYQRVCSDGPVFPSETLKKWNSQ